MGLVVTVQSRLFPLPQHPGRSDWILSTLPTVVDELYYYDDQQERIHGRGAVAIFIREKCNDEDIK